MKMKVLFKIYVALFILCLVNNIWIYLLLWVLYIEYKSMKLVCSGELQLIRYCLVCKEKTCTPGERLLQHEEC